MSRTCTFTPCHLNMDVRKVRLQKLSHAHLVIVQEVLKEGGMLPLVLWATFPDVAGDGILPCLPPFRCVPWLVPGFKGGELAGRLGRVPCWSGSGSGYGNSVEGTQGRGY
jgi:hypothetical protein